MLYYRIDELRVVPRLISNSDDPRLDAASVSCVEDPQKGKGIDCSSLPAFLSPTLDFVWEEFLRDGLLDDELELDACSPKKSSSRSRISAKEGRTSGVGSQH
mmetsp:Transcript_7078/g.11747  ORF Transcript_7078/g.11747 Transcript_7078/m.11747 type:complete len:102 (+) Transcript_7078:51-356(+)